MHKIITAEYPEEFPIEILKYYLEINEAARWKDGSGGLLGEVVVRTMNKKLDDDAKALREAIETLEKERWLNR
jgi:hypothetical protein